MGALTNWLESVRRGWNALQCRRNEMEAFPQQFDSQQMLRNAFAGSESNTDCNLPLLVLFFTLIELCTQDGSFWIILIEFAKPQ